MQLWRPCYSICIGDEANFASGEAHQRLLFTHIRPFCMATGRTVPKSTNVQLFRKRPHVGDGDADLSAR